MNITTDQLRALIGAIGYKHGVPPLDFLDTLRDTIKSLPDVLFDANSATHDIYAVLRATDPDNRLEKYFGTTAGRRALMAGTLTMIGGDEADWKWNTGRDTTAKLTAPENQEAGVFQVSYDSRNLHPALRVLLTQAEVYDVWAFQARMKLDHKFAIRYVVNLLRVTTTWDGPINRGWVVAQVTPKVVDAWLAAFA